MAEDPQVIRADIQRTRAEMTETADALAYKANVPARTKGWAARKVNATVDGGGRALSKVSDATDSLVAKVSGSVPSSDEVGQQASNLKDTAEHNPFGLGLAAAAVGFVAGLFSPSTRVEDEKLGPVSDQVKSSAVEAGQEALDHGKEVAEAATRSAVETAKREGKAYGEDLASSLQEKAREVSPSEQEVSSSVPERS